MTDLTPSGGYIVPSEPLPHDIPSSPPFIKRGTCSSGPCFTEGPGGPEFNVVSNNIFQLQDQAAAYVRNCLNGAACRPQCTGMCQSGYCSDGTTCTGNTCCDEINPKKCTSNGNPTPIDCGTGACHNSSHTCISTRDIPKARHVEESLQEQVNMGVRVVRTWGFDDTQTMPDDNNYIGTIQRAKPCTCRLASDTSAPDPLGDVCESASGLCPDGSTCTPSATNPTKCLRFQSHALQALDYVIWRAQQKKLRVVLPFGNWRRDYGGVPQYLRWHGCAAENDPVDQDEDSGLFFQLPVFRQHYQAYIKHIVWRRNSFLCTGSSVRCDGPAGGGRPYRDDPTIMGWELMNEPRGVGTEFSGSEMWTWVANVA
jgi:hypothetical protein